MIGRVLSLRCLRLVSKDAGKKIIVIFVEVDVDDEN